jgi:glycosyltransferase involved in cell wall biosynthesis
VVDGETGLLADPDDRASFAKAILSLLNDPEQAQQIGKRGQARVYSHFSARRMADDMIALYDKVMSMKGGLAASLQ